MKKNLDQYVQAFFGLISDHGRFRECQLHRYVEMHAGRPLLDRETAELTAIAERGGATRNKLDVRLFELPIAKRKPFPKGAADKLSLDLFDPSRGNR